MVGGIQRRKERVGFFGFFTVERRGWAETRKKSENVTKLLTPGCSSSRKTPPSSRSTSAGFAKKEWVVLSATYARQLRVYAIARALSARSRASPRELVLSQAEGRCAPHLGSDGVLARKRKKKTPQLF